MARRPFSRALRPLLLSLMALGAPTLAPAAPAPDDPYVAGYAGAVLEREFRVTRRAVTVDNGVLTLDGAQLTGADRAAVVPAGYPDRPPRPRDEQDPGQDADHADPCRQPEAFSQQPQTDEDRQERRTATSQGIDERQVSPPVGRGQEDEVGRLQPAGQEREGHAGGIERRTIKREPGHQA